ncbi:MAG: hypothetical protein ACI8TF_000137 [Paracoccaceae bacterium]|jgi:hypothetical protein
MPRSVSQPFYLFNDPLLKKYGTAQINSASKLVGSEILASNAICLNAPTRFQRTSADGFRGTFLHRPKPRAFRLLVVTMHRLSQNVDYLQESTAHLRPVNRVMTDQDVAPLTLNWDTVKQRMRLDQLSMIFRLKPAHILSRIGGIDLKPVCLRKNHAVIISRFAKSHRLWVLVR